MREQPVFCFYARTDLNAAVGSLGFTCLPRQYLLLPGRLIHLLHIWLHTYFHGFLFPIKQKPCTSSSGQPVSEVLWNVTQTPWEQRKWAVPSLGSEHGSEKHRKMFPEIIT